MLSKRWAEPADLNFCFFRSPSHGFVGVFGAIVRFYDVAAVIQSRAHPQDALGYFSNGGRHR
jgi:hypothetical protein